MEGSKRRRPRPGSGTVRDPGRHPHQGQSNFGGGGGRYFPSIVSVALGEPGTPVICWAKAGAAASMTATINARIVGKTALSSHTFLL